MGLSWPAMGTGDKGFIRGSMGFQVGGDDDGPIAQEAGPVLPLRLLLISNLVPHDDYNAGAHAPETPIRVDPKELDELFDKLRPRLQIEVPSVLDDGRMTKVSFGIKALRSFRPDGLAEELPLIQQLIDGRRYLERLREGTATPEQARLELSRLWGSSPLAAEVLGLVPNRDASRPAPPPPAAAPDAGPASASDGELGGLLDMIDMGDGGSDAAASSAPSAPAPAKPAAPSHADRISKFISTVAAAAKSGKTTNPAEAIRRVEEALGAQLGAVLQHPEVRRLEQAWRGVAFVAERAQNQPGVQLEVLSVPANQAAAALTKAASAPGAVPVTTAVVDVEIDGSNAGLELARAIAEAAEATTTPAIIAASPGLLGQQDLYELDRVDNKKALFEDKRAVVWRTTAEKPCMRWLTIAINPILSRTAYTKQTSRLKGLTVREEPHDEGHVWMSPAYGVASLIVRSFGKTGWPCRIVGTPNGGVIENLPVLENDRSGHTIAVPTQAFISTQSQKDLSRVGIMALASAPNDDSAILIAAPTAYVPPPKTTYEGASAQQERLDPVSLVDQLFVARIVQFTRALAAKIPPNSDPSELQPVFEAAVWTLFENGPPAGPQIDVQARHDAEGQLVAQLVVRPRGYLGVSTDEFGLELPIG